MGLYSGKQGRVEFMIILKYYHWIRKRGLFIFSDGVYLDYQRKKQVSSSINCTFQK